MQVVTSQGTPIYTGYVSRISSIPRKRRFGQKPFAGLNGCGCGPVNGCRCTTGLQGLGQTSSLDQIINNAFQWLSGTVQSHLPASASVPPQYGSTGSISTAIQEWLPWMIGGFLVYKLVKK